MPRLERKLRVMIDWTVALFFPNDVVKLELFGERHPVADAVEITEAQQGERRP
jgi:hypothetical protein